MLTVEQIASVHRALSCGGLWPIHGLLRFLFGPDLHCAARRPRSPMTARSGLSTAQASDATVPLPVASGAPLAPAGRLASSRPEPGVSILRHRRRSTASRLPGLAATALFPPDDQGGNAELRRQAAQRLPLEKME